MGRTSIDLGAHQSTAVRSVHDCQGEKTQGSIAMHSKQPFMTDHPPTGQAIPKGSLPKKFYKYVERVTGKKSLSLFLLQGTIFAFFAWLPTIVGSILRGVAYRSILGGIGKSCLIEKGVRLAVPKRIFMGNRTFIGQFSYLDPKVGDTKIVLGDDVYISRLCRISSGSSNKHRGQVVIENNVHVGQNSFLDGTGGLTIGKDSLFGPNVVIMTGNHVFEDPSVPIRLQGGIPKPITIEEDVWLGSNVTVLGGVTVGKGSVVGAGSVVTKNIPPFSITVGNPARIIGRRGDDICGT